MECPYCQSQDVNKRGFDSLQDGTLVQRYQCKDCHRHFNARTGTLMARLRTASSVVSYAIKARTEGMGVRAAGRTFGQSHTTIMRWEKRLADPAQHWSPPAPAASEVMVEGDEVYTRVGEPLPPSQSQGWTIHFLECESRYWLTAQSEGGRIPMPRSGRRYSEC